MDVRLSTIAQTLLRTGAALAVGCAAAPPAATVEASAAFKPCVAGTIAFDDNGRFAYSQPPILLLAALSRADFVTVGPAPKGWTTKTDVEWLMALRDSTTPCGSTVSVISSSLPTKPSTLGREALFLIEGYRAGTFPPGLTSGRCKLTSAAAEQWWKDGAKVTPRDGSSDVVPPP